LTAIADRIAALSDECISLRRDLHMHPELGQEEFRTSSLVADHLQACGIPVQACTPTGVVGLLEGEAPGPTLLLRADMDALPIQEENDLPYRSTIPGVMHACGHDAHTAMLLTAAKVLAGLRHRLRGNVKFVFQPNEENVGALAMIEAGAMETPRVDACMALHVWNPLPSGLLGCSAGPIMAGMEHFQLVVNGKGGHTATPHNAVDPVLAAAAIVQGVQCIQTREVDALAEPTVIMFGQINGGTASNVIPDAVTLRGTMRYIFSNPEGESPTRRFERVTAGICAAHQTTCAVEYQHGHPTLVNDQGMVDMVHEVLRQDMAGALVPRPLVTLAGEDFSEFASRAPAAFCFLGAGYEGGRCYPHHHPRFDIDESVLSKGVALHVFSALRYLQG